MSALSPLEFVERELENPVVQAGLLFFNGLREVDLRCRGFGHHIAALLASTGKAQMCVGGSAALARALVSAVTEIGGEIQLQKTPRRILVRDGKAVGVETSDGATYHARHFVVSGLNPQQTFLGLIEEEHLPREWREKARQFQYNLIAPLFALYVNLRERPRYLCRVSPSGTGEGVHGDPGAGGFRAVREIVRHHEAGTIPPTVMWGSCPTQFDASQAPAGQHTAFMWEKLPYRLER